MLARTSTATPTGVLHVIDSLGLGGAQAILKDFFEYRTSSGAIFLYALRVVPGQLKIGHPNVSVNPSSWRFSMAPMLKLRAIVDSCAVDILHCHLFRAQVFGYLLKTIFFPRLVLVFHEHGRAVGREGESWIEAMLFRWFLAAAWRSVDAFVCNSDYTRKRLLEVIPGAAERVTVAPNPIRVHPRESRTEARRAARERAGVPDGSFVVGFAGRLVKRKGWHDFLLAIQRLEHRIPVFFLVAGDGEDREKVEACIRELGLEGRGRTLGHVSRMDGFYEALDCFAMPSHWEPAGLVHLEAQGHAVPVVVSDVSGLNETVHADIDALLFPAGDPAALAERIFRIASDSELREGLASRGHDNAGRFTLDAFGSRLDGLYSTILAECRHSR